MANQQKVFLHKDDDLTFCISTHYGAMDSEHTTPYSV